MSEMPPPRALRASRSQPPLAPRPNPKAGPPTAPAAIATTAASTASTAPTQEAPPPEQHMKAASDIQQRLRTLQELRPDDLDHDEVLDTVDELLVQCRGDKGQSKARTPDPDEDLLLELALQVKMSEKTVTAKLKAMEQMLLRQAVATEQWRASVTSELLKLNDTLNSTVDDIRASLNAIAWDKVDATVQPSVSQPSVSAGISTSGANGAATVTGKQVGAGTSVGGTSDKPAITNQEGGGGLTERFRNNSVLSVENTPILLDELKEVLRVGNLQYVVVYMTYYDDTAHKVKLSARSDVSDFAPLIDQGGVVLPHMKNCQDWNAFLADRRKWATRAHFTHCRAKN